MKNPKENNQKLIDLFFEIGTLRKIMRSHRQVLGTDDLSDNIASHSFRVAMIGYFLAQMEKVDILKVLTMCLFHDLSETRSGDQNWVHKGYVKVFENEIFKDQLVKLPDNTKMLAIINEYQKKESLEAKVAKDADLIDQILLLREYEWTGSREAKIWLKGKEQEKRLSSKSAKSLVKQIYTHNPDNWWINIWTADRK